MAKVSVQITASKLNIRTGPSTSYKSIGTVSKGEKFSSSKQSNGWYYLDSKKGWASGVQSSYLKVVSNTSTTSSKASSKVNTKITTHVANSSGKSTGIDKKVLNMLLDSAKSNERRFDGSTRLFGAPFQFTKETDFRLSGNKYDLGRKYIDTMIAEAPIVYFMPGKPNFLPDMAKEQKNAFSSFFKSQKVDGSANKSALNAILGNDDVRYFDFLADYGTYIKYVNLLCRTAAIYMGIGDRDAPVDALATKYRWFDWSNYRYEDAYKVKNEKIDSIFDVAEMGASKLKDELYRALFGSYQYVQFYVDASTSFNESSTNQTADSKLAGAFDTGQGLIKELSFFLNAGGMSRTDAWFKEQAAELDNLADKMGEGLFSKLGHMGATLVSGSNIIFPEIWGDAAYNKSYNITVNLVSPYGDKESIYLNIIVPLLHLIALALPRQTTANSFTNPFLVKVSSKGWFNCEMGIIDNISIEKATGSWTVDGLPSEVKVQVSVKDLYSTLSITANNQPALFFENKGLINWLAVTCGLDVTKPAFEEKWQAILMSFMNSAVDIPGNVYNSVLESVRSNIERLWKI